MREALGDVGQGDAQRLCNLMQVHGIPAELLAQLERGIDDGLAQRIGGGTHGPIVADSASRRQALRTAAAGGATSQDFAFGRRGCVAAFGDR